MSRWGQWILKRKLIFKICANGQWIDIFKFEFQVES